MSTNVPPQPYYELTHLQALEAEAIHIIREVAAIKHTTRWGRALVKDLQYRLDINTLHRDEQSHALALNEIGRVSLRTTVPLFFDEYRRNRATGSFILVDEAANNTVGAGIIIGPSGVA